MQLTAKQSEAFLDKSRFKMLVTGRRGGKTYYNIAELLTKIQPPKQKVMYIAPTREQAKDIFWKDFLEICPSTWIKTINKSSLSIELINGSILYIKSAKAMERIRGAGLNHATIDEAQDTTNELIKEILRPALSDRKGSLTLTATPKGYNYLYDIKPNYSFHTWTTLEGGLVDKEEIELARELLDPRTFRQEYEASFENYTGIIAYRFTEDNLKDYNLVNGLVYLSFDFNINPMSCVVLQKVDNGFAVLKEFQITNSNTYDCAEKVNYWLQQQGFSGEIYFTGDASGSNGNVLDRNTHTNFDIISSCLHYKTTLYKRSTNGRKEDQFNTLNSALETAAGVRKLFINSNCTDLIKSLRQTTRDDYKKGDPRGVTHVLDALLYFTYNFMPLYETRTIIL